MSVWQKNISLYLSWATCAAYAGLFFDLPISNTTLFVLLAVCLLSFNASRLVKSIRANISVQLLILFYLLHVVALLYTQNLPYGLFVLEKKVTLLVLPLILFPALYFLTPEEKSNLFFKFGVITIISSLLFLLIAFAKQFLYNYELAFHRDYFPSIPYVFYSMYFATGSLLLLNSLSERSQKSTARIVFLILLAIYSLALLIIIASKTGIIAYVVGLTYFLFRKLPSKRLFFFSMTIVIFSLVVFLVAYPSTLERFTELRTNLSLIKENKLTHYEEFTGLNLRLFFWKTALVQLWEDNLLITGVGTGDAQDYLDHAYSVKNLDKYGFTHFDPHNQWIMTLLQLGIIGVLILGAVFYTGLRGSAKGNDMNFIFFAVIVIFFSFSESILESNKGVVFFALFFCLLTSQKQQKLT